MTRFARPICVVAALLAVCTAARAQQMPFEDVVRSLSNPDPETRLSALQLLRDSKYPEAAVPIAPLINDPVNAVQLEAISAELSLFLVEELPVKPRSAFIIELRPGSRALRAFELGPLATWPQGAPQEVVAALLEAINDDSRQVRVEAIYALGVLGRGPVDGDTAAHLSKALEHPDPAVRAGAAHVAGRLRVAAAVDALMKAVNDSAAPVRFSSMRALGEIGDPRAVETLQEQFRFYEKGEGAWSALEGLARIAQPTSVPLFKASLGHRDPQVRRAAAEGLGRAGDKSLIAELQEAATNDESEIVRAASAFALLKAGQNYVDRLIDFLYSDRMTPQIRGYFLELGPSMIRGIVPRLREPDATTRRHLAETLGAIGDESTVSALEHLANDRDQQVVAAAARAIERIRMRRAARLS